MEHEESPLLSRAVHRAASKQRASSSGLGRIKGSLAAVLVTETLERIAFYGIVGNLVMFLNVTPFEWTFYNATNAFYFLTGIGYMWSLIGGWIADSFCGKFKTILVFFVVYIMGYVFFPLLYPYPDPSYNVTADSLWCSRVPSAEVVNSSANQALLMSTPNPIYSNNSRWHPIAPSQSVTESCVWVVYVALALVAVGNGAVKANISPFGAEQVQHLGPAAVRIFVNWFYWCINIGALVSLGGLAYLQQEYSFFWGYVAPGISLVLAAIVFTSGLCVYIQRPSRGSILTNIIKILCEACHKSCCYKRPQTYGLVSGSPELYANIPSSCLDHAKIQYGGSYHGNMVDDVKTLVKICMIFMAMIPYWIVYLQMETTFLFQGLHMRLGFSDRNSTSEHSDEAKHFKIPAAWLSLFDVFFIILLLPLFDRVIYPALDRRGYVLSPRSRIVIGMCFSMISMVTAGCLEMYRLHIFWLNDKPHPYAQLIGYTKYNAADVSILWQIPQYALIGTGEVFASVAGLELAYVLAPRSMQGLITGLFWFTQGLGAFVGTGIMYGFRGIWFFQWDHGDINCRHMHCSVGQCACHLDYFFFFLAGLQLVGILIFCITAWRLDVGVQSAHNQKQDTGQPESLSSEGSTIRPGYRTFGRQISAARGHVSAVTRADSTVSEADTLDTDTTIENR